jgi:hypothetical protein
MLRKSRVQVISAHRGWSGNNYRGIRGFGATQLSRGQRIASSYVHGETEGFCNIARQIVGDLEQVSGFFAAAAAGFDLGANFDEAFLAADNAGVDADLVGNHGFTDQLAKQLLEAR